MLINSTKQIPVSDINTQHLCLELIGFLSDNKGLEVEASINACSKLNDYLKEVITENPSFYSATELKFLIVLLQELSDKIELDKQQVAVKIISQQRSNKAVDKYKANT
ncbi:hypothetical protein [Pseudoalteromonas distincta]|uniref:hypothetical protein n=1 Tax=Pseudoalteromonas distincta TaxID=77608 RepID=UPI0032E086F7